MMTVIFKTEKHSVLSAFLESIVKRNDDKAIKLIDELSKEDLLTKIDFIDYGPDCENFTFDLQCCTNGTLNVLKKLHSKTGILDEKCLSVVADRYIKAVIAKERLIKDYPDSIESVKEMLDYVKENENEKNKKVKSKG